MFEGGNKRLLTSFFFINDTYMQNRNVIAKLTYEDFMDPTGNPIDQLTFHTNAGLILTPEKYLALQRLMQSSKLKYSKNDPIDKKSLSVFDFLGKIKKGSKKIRKILNFSEQNVISNNIVKYSEITETIINLENSKIQLLINCHFFKD
jgi:hypothetical protein